MLPAYISGKKSTLSSILIALGLLILFFDAITPSPIHLIATVAITVFAFIIESINSNPIPKEVIKKALLFIIIMWLCGVVCSLIWWRSKILNLGDLELLIYGVCLALLISYKNIRVFPIQVAFYIISAYLINRCIFQNAAFDELFYYSGNGYMISVLLSIASIIQLIEWRENHTISILPPVIIFILSFYSWSRTALGCSLLYLLVVIFFALNGKLKVNKGAVFALFIIVVAVASYYLWNKFSIFFSENELMAKIEEHGASTTGRDEIWSYYLSQLDLVSLFFGVNFENGTVFNQYGGDMHNSYIQLHATIGLVAFWVYYILIKTGKILFQRNRLIFFLFIVMFVRGFFDALYFWNYYDFAIFIYVIYASQPSIHNKEIEKDIKLSII